MLPGLGNKPLIKRLGLADLSASVQALINGALQKSGGTMLADILLPGNTSQALGAVPKQQAESIATSAATSAANTAESNAKDAALGFSQTWQSVSRSSGVTYYNTTGRPIEVFISANVGNGSSGGDITLSIGPLAFNQIIASGAAQLVGSAAFTVPTGASYVYIQSGVVSSVSVFELR